MTRPSPIINLCNPVFSAVQLSAASFQDSPNVPCGGRKVAEARGVVGIDYFQTYASVVKAATNKALFAVTGKSGYILTNVMQSQRFSTLSFGIKFILSSQSFSITEIPIRS